MTFRSVYSTKLTDNQVRKIFIEAKYRKVVSCSQCSGLKIGWINDKKFRCKRCWNISSLTKNTWVEGSKLSLRIWYEFTWCFVLGHSANKAGKLIQISSRTCWSIYQTIRKALVRESLEGRQKITGTVEVDESFYGGVFKNLRKETRWKFRHEGKAKRGRGAYVRKQVVFGIYKRDGEVYLELIGQADKNELEQVIKRKIERKTEVFSDKFTGYDGLVGLGYVHSSVDHGMEIYVDGRIHINGMEGFWGLSITNMHTYKGIKKKNWILYLKEMEFRYNQRHMTFDETVKKIITILMTYRKESFVPS